MHTLPNKMRNVPNVMSLNEITTSEIRVSVFCEPERGSWCHRMKRVSHLISLSFSLFLSLPLSLPPSLSLIYPLTTRVVELPNQINILMSLPVIHTYTYARARVAGDSQYQDCTTPSLSNNITCGSFTTWQYHYGL